MPAKNKKKALAKKAAPKKIAKLKAANKPALKKTTARKATKPLTKLAKPVAKAKPAAKIKVKYKLVAPISKQIVANLKGSKKKYYEILMGMRAKILGQVQILSEETLTSGAVTGEHSSTMTNHLADYGSDNFLHGMELDIMSGEMEDLEMIDEALERLSSGEYGKCLDCGYQIPVARLEVKPHARFCVKCKSKREQEAEKVAFER
jgi:RNA polymerase-binding transcription factor DksA